MGLEKPYTATTIEEETPAPKTEILPDDNATPSLDVDWALAMPQESQSEGEIKQPIERSFLLTLEEAIINYELADPTNRVHWERNNQYASLSNYIAVLNENFTEEDYQGYTDGDKSWFDRMCKAAGIRRDRAIGKKRIDLFFTFAKQTLHDDFIYTHITLLPKDLRIVLRDAWAKVPRFSDEKITRFKEVKASIETSRNNNNSLLPSSFVLYKFLESNKGNLAVAIQECGEFMRYITRTGDVTSGAAWTRKHIADENHTRVSFNDLPADKPVETRERVVFSKPTALYNPDRSLLNQVGRLYHTFYIIDHLRTFPPEMIQGMVGIEYLLFGRDHGMDKFRSDLSLLKELKAIQNYLENVNNRY